MKCRPAAFLRLRDISYKGIMNKDLVCKLSVSYEKTRSAIIENKKRKFYENI